MIYKSKYYKTVSLLALFFYSGILFYSSFHYHNVKSTEEKIVAAENKSVEEQSIHNSSFCLIFHFASSQHFNSFNSYSNFVLPEIVLLFPSAVPLHNITETFSVSHRGPPVS